MTDRQARRRCRGWRRTVRHGHARDACAVRLLRSATRVARVLLVLAGLLPVAVVAAETAAYAQAPTEPGVDDLETVVNNIRFWLIGILFAVSTLYLTIGGFRYMWSNGDPGEVEKAKSAFRNAAIGYALAVLAPLVVTIVTGFCYDPPHERCCPPRCRDVPNTGRS